MLFEHGHRQLAALLAVHGQDDLLNKVAGLNLRGGCVGGIGPAFGDLHPHRRADAHVHGGVVHIHDALPGLFEVGVVVVFLHVLHGHVQGDDLGEGKEGGLENAVGPVGPQAHLDRQFGGVDDVELGVLPGQVPLHLAGETVLQLFRAPGAVQQVDAALLQVLRGVVFVDVRGGVDRHEVRGAHQVSRPDGLVAKAQVALGQAAGLHGVVGKIRLGVLPCNQADGADGVFIGSHGAVAAQAPQLAGNLSRMGQLHLCVIQGGVGHVVDDADGEAVFRRILPEIVIDGDELARGGVLGGKAVAAPHHLDVPPARLGQGGHHVQIHRLTHAAGLLGAVQHRDFLHRGGQSGGEVLHGEGAVQVDLQQAHLPALLVEVVHRLLHRLGGGAHDHDDFLRVLRAVVVEKLVIPARQLVDFVHVMLDGVRQGGGGFVHALLALEVDVRVHVVAPVGGMLRVQALAAERLEGLPVHQAPQVLVVQGLDALHLVGGAEAVKAVHEGVAGMDGGQMRHRPQVHGLLGRGGHEHGVAGGAAGHEVRVVAEDGVVVRSHHPGGDVHDVGQELAPHGVHGGDHQHQALGGGEGGGQRARLGRAVAGARRTRLGLHLDHVHRGPEQVLPPLGGPLVHLLRHGRRRRDGINRRHLREGVGHVGGRRVAVHYNIFFVHIGSAPSRLLAYT